MTELLTESQRIEQHQDEARVREEKRIAIEQFARANALQFDQAARLLYDREQAAEVLPDAFTKAQARTAKLARDLEMAEAAEAAIGRTAREWSSLLGRWEQQSALVVQAQDRAELNEAIATEQAELDVVRQALGDATREAALFGQLIQAERRARAYRRCAGLLREELVALEAELLQFAKRNNVEKRCLPEHLQKGLA